MLGANSAYNSKRSQPLRGDHDLQALREGNSNAKWSASNSSQPQRSSTHSRLVSPDLSRYSHSPSISEYRNRMSPELSSYHRRTPEQRMSPVDILNSMKGKAEYTGDSPKGMLRNIINTRPYDYLMQPSSPYVVRGSGNSNMKSTYSCGNEYMSFDREGDSTVDYGSGTQEFRDVSRMKIRGNVEGWYSSKSGLYSSQGKSRRGLLKYNNNGSEGSYSRAPPSNIRRTHSMEAFDPLAQTNSVADDSFRTSSGPFRYLGVMMAHASTQTTTDVSTQTLSGSNTSVEENLAEKGAEKPVQYATPPSTPLLQSQIDKDTMTMDQEEAKGVWDGQPRSCPTVSCMEKQFLRQTNEREAQFLSNPSPCGFEKNLELCEYEESALQKGTHFRYCHKSNPYRPDTRTERLIQSFDEVDHELEDIRQRAKRSKQNSDASLEGGSQRVPAPDIIMMNRGERSGGASGGCSHETKSPVPQRKRQDISLSPSSNKSFCFESRPPITAEKLRATRVGSFFGDLNTTGDISFFSQSGNEESFISQRLRALHMSDLATGPSASAVDLSCLFSSPDRSTSFVVFSERSAFSPAGSLNCTVSHAKH